MRHIPVREPGIRQGRGTKKTGGKRVCFFKDFSPNNITVKRGFINRETPFFSACSQKSRGRRGKTVFPARPVLEMKPFQAFFPLFSRIPLEKMNVACYINSSPFL